MGQIQAIINRSPIEVDVNATLNKLVITFNENLAPVSGSGITVKNLSTGKSIATNKLTFSVVSGNTLEISSSDTNMPFTSGGNNVNYSIAFNNSAVKDTSGAFLAATTVSTPIALDLDGNGISYLDRSAGVTYDYNGDGVAETTAWVAPNDGLLAHRTEDGKLEISFSTQPGETDLQGLAKQYDSNHDGVLDSKDVAFSQFGVWQDSDSNAVAGKGEFKTLTEAGITSISLTAQGEKEYTANGDVIVYGKTTYTTADGVKHTAEDVGFASSENLQVSTTDTAKIPTSLSTTTADHTGTDLAATASATTSAVSSTLAKDQTEGAVHSSDTADAAKSSLASGDHFATLASNDSTATKIVSGDVTHDSSLVSAVVHDDASIPATTHDASSTQYTSLDALANHNIDSTVTPQPIHLELGGVTYVIEPNLTQTINPNEILTSMSSHIGDPAPLIPGAWTEVVVATSHTTPVADASWTEIVSNPAPADPHPAVPVTGETPAAPTTETSSTTGTTIDHTLSNPTI